MKKTLAALLMGLATPALAVCTYPLDATQQQLAGHPLTASWTVPQVTGQAMEFLVQQTLPGAYLRNYAAFSASGIDALTTSYASGLPGGDVTLPASGIVAMEMRVDNFPAQPMTAGRVWLSMGMITGNWYQNVTQLPSDALQYNIVLSNSNVTPSPGNLFIVAESISNGVRTNGYQEIPVTLPLPANTKVGLYLNMDTRQMGMTAGGVDLGYILPIPAAVNSVSLNLGGMLIAVGSPEAQIGAPVGGTLITDAALFTEPFPAGVKDFCGNPSGGLRALPNGKLFPGKGKALGLGK